MIDPILIPMEDDLIHTDEHPVCDDFTCPCHEYQLILNEEKEYRSMCPECEHIYRGNVDYFSGLYEVSPFLPCGHLFRDLVDVD